MSLIKEANTLPALLAKHLARVHKICSIANFGNTVLQNVLVDNFGETNTFNHSHESGETSGVRAIVPGIMEIDGNVGKTNNFHDSHKQILEIVGFTNISNNFHECRKPREPEP